MLRTLTVLLLALLWGLPIQAQQSVTTSARDGLTLYGEFYLVDASRPTVLLLHELYTSRASWADVVPALTGSGYNVLAVDLRGYGQTRGGINWSRAVGDVGVWLQWLRETGGVRADGIFTMGSSMGSSLAIVGCASDPACRGAVAISPGWRYYSIPVRDSLTAHPILAIYAERDRWPSLGIPRMQEIAPDTLNVYAYPGNAHGMDLVTDQFDTLLPLVLEWLGTH
jgi:pimeloyl-ACP methyl ester carboxylesterase